jgi:hypothetical protein
MTNIYEVTISLPEPIERPPETPEVVQRYWAGEAPDEDAAVEAARVAWRLDYGSPAPGDAIVECRELPPGPAPMV